MNSARSGFVEARGRLGAKHASEMKIMNQVHPSMDKGSAKKKSSTALQMLASKILGMKISSELDADDTYKIDADHESENAGLTGTRSARKRQRMQEWLYDIEDLLAALDLHEEINTDGDSTTSSWNSETTLVPSTDYAPSTQEHTRQIQGRMNNMENTTGGKQHDEAASITSTMAEKDQPMRKLPRQYSSCTEC